MSSLKIVPTTIEVHYGDGKEVETVYSQIFSWNGDSKTWMKNNHGFASAYTTAEKIKEFLEIDLAIIKEVLKLGDPYKR